MFGISLVVVGLVAAVVAMAAGINLIRIATSDLRKG